MLELARLDTAEHADLRRLERELAENAKMMAQLRGKIGSLDFAGRRERLYAEKIGLINQSRKEELNIMNRENMQVSYEIDELMDRIANAKKKGKVNDAERSFFVTDESFQ